MQDEEPDMQFAARAASDRPEWSHRALHTAANDLSGDQFRRLIDANVFGVIVSSSSGDIYEANDAFLKMVGYTRSELRAGEIDWRALTPSKWAAKDENAVREMAHSGIVSPYFKEYLHKEGHAVPISLSGVRILDSNNRKICVIIDLTALTANAMPFHEDLGRKSLPGTNLTFHEILGAARSRYGLTNREYEVLREILRGRSSMEMASTFHISTATISDHVRNLLQKLNIRGARPFACVL